MSSVRSHLQSQYSLSDSRVDSVLIHSLTLEPPARLTNDNEAKEWISKVVLDYCNSKGISINSNLSTASHGSGNGSVAVVDSRALNEVKDKQNQLIKEQMKAMYEYLGSDPSVVDQLRQMSESLRVSAENDLKLWMKEHGESYWYVLTSYLSNTIEGIYILSNCI